MHSSGGTEEKMKVNDLSAKDYSIEDYLAESKTFLIPRYQRSYAWEKKNIVQLLEDVSKEEGYYIGNVIVNTSQNDEKEIIDGQQRIISIFLILIALHHVAGMNTLEYVLDNGNLKINIEKRIEDSGVSVMSSILDDNIASTMKKYNEVARYKDIASILKKYEENQLETLRKNLLKAKIVEIKFLNGEKRAHEMFVNLNTKGKPLEEIEIIKSHLFKYLIEGENSDQYKEEWYEMLDDIGDKYHGKYLQNISLFKSLTKKKQTAKESLNYLLGEISNEETASSVFGFMAGDENASLFRVYSAVKNHDLLRLKTYIGHEAEISIDMLDQIWKMYGQVKFEQFDVVMVALLYIPSKEKKNLFSKNYLDIIKFLKLVLLFQIHNTVHRVSPSTYTNRFNSKGKFNVPCGKRDKIVCNKEKMEEISKKIQNVEFFCMDYNLFIDKILEKEKKKSIFMYCDPPYMPETESSQKHILYTQNGFEHERFIEYMDEKCCKEDISVMISMAETKNVEQLYKEHVNFNKVKIEEIVRKVNPTKKMKSKEVAFVNYEVDENSMITP